MMRLRFALVVVALLGGCSQARRPVRLQTLDAPGGLGQRVASASGAPHVLVVYADDGTGQIVSVANAIKQGAVMGGAEVQLFSTAQVNYDQHVRDWADVVVLGSGVYNGNAAPDVLAFVNTFNFADDLSGLLGGSFSTGGGAVAGLQPVLEQMNRALQTFRFTIVGGNDWRNSQGTGVVTNSTTLVAEGTEDYDLAYGQGGRMAQMAAALKRGMNTPTPSVTPTPTSFTSPPGWGELWSARVEANLTQVGYDAGLVIVNFTAMCNDNPKTQQMRTTYGDFYTVLTRCDLGMEFTIAPASRGGACTSRLIGRDVDSRICAACGCPFCVRDTNGTFTAGEGDHVTVTTWDQGKDAVIDGVEVVMYEGRAEGADEYDLKTSIAYDAQDKTKPVFVNISHPLWVSTAAAIRDFTHDVDGTQFDIPDDCPRPTL